MLFRSGKIDAGNILLQREVPVLPEDNFLQLHNRLAAAGARLVMESLELVASGDFNTSPQDESQATPAPKVKPQDMRIDWNRPAEEIHNQIRAFSPYPAAYTFWEGKRLKVMQSKIVAGVTFPPGMGKCLKNQLIVGCGDELNLELKELQMEGKRCMPCQDFVCGIRKDSLKFE